MIHSGRRRRWSAAEKVRIVEESLSRPRVAAVTARRYDISRTLLTRWRKEYREGLLGLEPSAAFSPVIAAEPGQGRDAAFAGAGDGEEVSEEYLYVLRPGPNSKCIAPAIVCGLLREHFGIAFRFDPVLGFVEFCWDGGRSEKEVGAMIVPLLGVDEAILPSGRKVDKKDAPQWAIPIPRQIPQSTLRGISP